MSRLTARMEASGPNWRLPAARIGSNDLLIAAHACALGATMVSANVGEFRRVSNLNVENWLE